MTADDAREIWFLPSPDSEGTFVFNAHLAGQCAGAWCAIHHPSSHWARDLPLRLEYKQGVGGRMLRVCGHGAEHDDPDDLAFRKSRGMPSGRYSPCKCGCPCNCELDDPPF